ncbi:hypothetical protein J2T57_004480, partial [Natronocella acetinitrilica]|nr:hypothetical protein [Natronocella acetinitrilica]
EALGRYWLETLQQGHSPTLVELQVRFGTQGRHGAVPPMTARQHALADYDALLREVRHG